MVPAKRPNPLLHWAALCTAIRPGLSLSAAADAALASLGGVESMLKQGDFDGVRHTGKGRQWLLHVFLLFTFSGTQEPPRLSIGVLAIAFLL